MRRRHKMLRAASEEGGSVSEVWLRDVSIYES